MGNGDLFRTDSAAPRAADLTVNPPAGYLPRPAPLAHRQPGVKTVVQPPPARPALTTAAPAPRSTRRRPGRWCGATAALALAAALAAGPSGCGTEPVAFHENPVGVLPQDSLSRDWLVDLNRTGAGRQVVTLDCRSKLLYAYTADKHVTAIDRRTGVVQYSMAVNSPESRLQPLVELEGFVVFPNATNLQVFDDKGQFIKTVVVPTPIRSTASAESSEVAGTNHGTTVYFGASGIRQGGLVEAYDIGRAAAFEKWEFITHDQGAIVAAPAVLGGIIYTGDDQGEVDAVSLARLPVWETEGGTFTTGGAIVADLRADESGLYVASSDSKLYCINRATGKLLWQYFAAAPLVAAPILTPDTVYQITPNRGLVALDKTAAAVAPAHDAPLSKSYDRRPRWTYPMAEQFLAQDAKYTYVAEARPNPADAKAPLHVIVALDKQTGRKAFESARQDFTCFGINPRDGLIYVAFAGGKLMAVQPVLRPGQIGELVLAVPPAAPAVPAVALAR